LKIRAAKGMRLEFQLMRRAGQCDAECDVLIGASDRAKILHVESS
jgi:hypothetical protein